jgi:lysozyme family protein
MKHLNDTSADGLATTSIISFLATLSTQMQPIITALAGLIAIISGLFAIRYYYLKTKK